MLKITQYPKDFDGRPLDLLAAVATDINGNAGAQFPQSIVGPDGAPIDKVGMVLVDKAGNMMNAGAFDETIYAKDLGIVADGITINSAAAVNAALLALADGGQIKFTAGHIKFDNTIHNYKRCVFTGVWMGPSTSGVDTDAVTLLEFPAGCTGIRHHHWQAQNSLVERMRIKQTAQITTASIASFTSGGSTLTLLSANVLNIVNTSFDSDVSGWLTSNATVAWVAGTVGGRARVTKVGAGTACIYQAVATVIGQSYTLAADAILGNAGSGNISVRCGTAPGLGDLGSIGTAGRAVNTFTATGALTYISLCVASGATNGNYHDFDNVDGGTALQNGQVVQLDGAGHDIVLADRAFSTVNGSPDITWAYTDGQFRGNSIGYRGQEISLAGFAAGTYIVDWGIGTATLSTNATATASGLTATITTPLVTEIVSGAGTTALAIADIPYTGGKTVTNRRLRHCAPGIYSTIQCHTRDVEIFSTDAGMVLAGITTGAAVADNCSNINTYFRGSRFGLVQQGADAQVNSYLHCNFAGPEVGVLDQSYISNDYAHCHWAFNCGMMSSASMKVIGGYMESGTSYISAGASSFMLGTVSFVPGSGFAGFAAGGGVMTTGQLNAARALVDAAFIGSGPAGAYIRIQPGQSNPPGGMARVGAGIEANYDGTRHWWLNVTQGGGANDKDWRLQGQQLELWNSAGGVAKTLAGKFDLYAGITYSINGTQVVQQRETGWTADTGTARKGANATYGAGAGLTFGATYVQAEHTAVGTRLGLIETALQNISQTQKSLKDALITHGLIGA